MNQTQTWPVRAVCPGSFDPISRGHLDIIGRASAVFPDVIVAVGRNTSKSYLFTFEERLALTTDAVADIPGVRVAAFDGLLVDFCAQYQARVIIKGIRFGSDFDYELQMAQLNHQLSGVETLLLPAGTEFGAISSSLLREIAQHGGDIAPFVTDAVNRAVLAKLGR